MEIAPVYLRLPERIRARGLICFMPLLLYWAMRQRLQANGSSHSPSTVLELLRRIQQRRALKRGARDRLPQPRDHLNESADH